VSPTQQQRAEATTAALVEAARELFAEDGYAATSLDAVVAKAGVTKGALYHHFGGKRELFTAVFVAEQARLTAAIVDAYGAHRDPWKAFAAGAAAFIKACQEPGIQRIVLLDAPAAIGWEKIRQLETGSLRMVEAGLQRAIEAKAIDPRPVEPLASLLFGGICESAMAVARSDDQARALRNALRELDRLLAAISSLT
jgi:AcrR family transcriptional regulator